MAVKKNDHWDKMASFMRDLFLQTDDERIGAVYKKLHAAGWDQREFPLSTRNADKEIKWFAPSEISEMASLVAAFQTQNLTAVE